MKRTSRESRCGIAIVVVTACLLTGHVIGHAEEFGPANAAQEDSRHPIAFRGGAGFGVPYGFMGCQLGIAAGRIHGSTALGFVPWAWEPAVSLNAGLIFRRPTESLRPKITLTISNAVGVAAIIDGASLDALYCKTYGGIGVYGGATWRLGSGSTWCLDFDLGYLIPFAGNDQIEQDYEAAVAHFESRGYVMKNEQLSLGGPKISVGLLWSPPRTR